MCVNYGRTFAGLQKLQPHNHYFVLEMWVSIHGIYESSITFVGASVL